MDLDNELLTEKMFFEIEKAKYSLDVVISDNSRILAVSIGKGANDKNK